MNPRKPRKDTKWISEKFELIRDVIAGSASLGTATFEKRKEAGSALIALTESLYKVTCKRNRRDGSGERSALFEIKSQLRRVYESLSFDAKPYTVARFVKRLVDDLEDSRRALKRAEESIVQISQRAVASMEGAFADIAERPKEATGANGPGPVLPPWRADPPAPKTERSLSSIECIDDLLILAPSNKEIEANKSRFKERIIEPANLDTIELLITVE